MGPPPAPMKASLNSQLEAWIESGRNILGQVMILTEEIAGAARYYLIHHLDREIFENDRDVLTPFWSAEDARVIGRFDKNGDFRPLRSAPDLRRGWLMELHEIDAVREALDYLYPAAIGNCACQQAGSLQPTHLRETLQRQTGMYKITRQLTPEQAQEVLAETCDSRGACLKTILWKIDENHPATSLPDAKFDPESSQIMGPDPASVIPVFCREACNAFVTAARETLIGQLKRD